LLIANARRPESTFMVSHMEAGYHGLICNVGLHEFRCEVGKFRKAFSCFRKVKVAAPKSNGIMVHKCIADKPLFLF
jgi:hypothetical protein